MLKRYKCVTTNGLPPGPYHSFVESDCGEWIKYEDHLREVIWVAMGFIKQAFPEISSYEIKNLDEPMKPLQFRIKTGD